MKCSRATCWRRSRAKPPRPRTSPAVCRASSNSSKRASPSDPAVISEIDGVVKYGEIAKGQRKIYVESEDGKTMKEYSISRGVHINVQEGEHVQAGEPLIDGPLNPHDILAVLGEKYTQAYLVNSIQEVYRLQGVNINDKHIETIVRQMMRWVKVEDVGDTTFLLEEQVDKFRFREENDRIIQDGGRPATGRPLLLGITKASLSTDSFISAASFQETTRVLTEAAISGKVDYLRGLKENVIMGRLIPAGTGLERYRNIQLLTEIPKEEPQQTRAGTHPGRSGGTGLPAEGHRRGRGRRLTASQQPVTDYNGASSVSRRRFLLRPSFCGTSSGGVTCIFQSASKHLGIVGSVCLACGSAGWLQFKR